jgi:alkylhydroperoxidase/carboxymuconolactone decarboxylase family protein YurZ
MNADDLQALKARYEAASGSWNGNLEAFLREDPEMFAAYVDFVETTTSRSALDAKTRELIQIAVNVATTHLYEPAVRLHIGRAVTAGATAEEVIEVFELVTALGMHTFSMGAPILIEELSKRGRMPGRSAEAMDVLRRNYVDAKGYWSDLLESILVLDPEFFRAYVAYTSIPVRKGYLSRKVQELIKVAIDCATTHLYEPGLRLHIGNAINNGASTEELIETYELTSLIGFQSFELGLSVLRQTVLDPLRQINAKDADHAEN